MPTLRDRLSSFWESVEKSPRDLPTYGMIDHDHIDSGNALATRLNTDQDYFEVRIKEMYLSNQREWFSKFDPMVCTIAEFGYGGEDRALPFIVGPSLVKQQGLEVPEGKMLYTNTCVAGPYPYRGEGLKVAVVLYGLQVKNYARDLMKFVEGAAGILDLAIPVSSYLKVADLVLDGVEALTGTAEQAKPILGIRQEFSPVEPGYCVLIAAPNIDEKRLWVKKDKLYYGASASEAQPFRESDYVLYSITSPAIGDINVSKLPFFKSWQFVLKDAQMASKPDFKESAKVNLSAVLADISVSSDLTDPHKQALCDKYAETATTLIKQAEGRGKLGEATDESGKPAGLASVRSKALAVLDL